MIKYIDEHNIKKNQSEKIVVSVEIEKAKTDLIDLIPLADVLFVAKDYAVFHGYKDMEDTLDKITLLTKEKYVF